MENSDLVKNCLLLNSRGFPYDVIFEAVPVALIVLRHSWSESNRDYSF